MAVVFGRWQAIGHRSQARSITTCRHLLSERLMRPLEIVDFAPGIEGALRFGEIAKAAQCEHLGFERAVEAFVLAATLRVIRPAMNDMDTKLEKPYRKPCPPFTRGVSPGRAVVDEECLRQAVAAEGQFQTAAHVIAALIAESLQAQVIARMIVYHRQWMALRVVTKPHPALEVHLPQQIWRQHLKTLAGHRASKRRFDTVRSAQDLMDGRKCRRTLVLALHTAHDLASSPRRMRVTHRENALLNLPICPLRARMRTARTVRKVLVGLPTAKPFIAGVRMNTEPPAELPSVRALLHCKPHKLAPLFHHRHLAPWHGLGLPNRQIHAL